MTKIDILCELHAVIGARLFGEGPWLMEREDALLTRQWSAESIQSQSAAGATGRERHLRTARTRSNSCPTSASDD